MRFSTAVIFALLVIGLGVLFQLVGPHAKSDTGYTRPTEYEGTHP